MERIGAASRCRSACAASVVATALALAAHLAGGGSAPGWRTVLVALGASLWVFLLLAARRFTTGRLLVGTLLGHVAFHYTFVFASMSGGAPLTTSGHDRHGSTPTLHVGQHNADGLLTHADPRMWAWHVVGAIATTAAITCGTRLLNRVNRALRPLIGWVGRLWRPAPLSPVRSASRRAYAGRPALRTRKAPSERFLLVTSHRGPPRVTLTV